MHFVDNIHPQVGHLGVCLLRPFGLESATTNRSETFNCVLKRLQDWKEAPIDALILNLFRLSQFHIVEIRCMRCGQGDFTLPEGVEPADSDEVLTIATHNPDVIVERIRAGVSRAQCNLTAAERASVVINSGQISFEGKLSIFTVNGTGEPHVVRLFPSV